MASSIVATPNQSGAVGAVGAKAARLSHRAIWGTLWTVFGFGFNQGIRLASSLVVTRLLAPDAFGMMALVVVFLIGVELLSDVGLRGSVIHHERGDCPDFLDTVWTIQVIRGFALWLVCVALAYPVSLFYQTPALAQLLPVAGLSAVIRGFASTHIYTVNRHLSLRWLTTIQGASQLAAATVTITAAYYTRSVWALVLGALSMALTRTISSHMTSQGSHRNRRFYWDKQAASSLMSFGGWILVGSGLGFLLSQGDRLILGRVLDPTQLGVYWVGATLAAVPLDVFQRLGTSVVQPTCARLHSSRTPLRKHIVRIRGGIAGLLLPGMFVLTIFADKIVRLLYDNRYSNAGVIVAGLALSGIIRVCTDLGPVFASIGDSRSQFKIVLVRCVSTVTSMMLGALWGGSHGLVIGLCVSPVVSYPWQAILYSRINLWTPLFDLLCVVTSLSIVACGIAIRWNLEGQFPL